MTVKELFLSVDFHSVAEALKTIHPECKSIKCLAGYKVAFDTICNMEFEGCGGEVTFDFVSEESGAKPSPQYMRAHDVEGNYWKNTVGKTVVRPDGNPFTDAELAAAILWGMTFLGFTRHHRWSPFERVFSRYGEMAERLECKLYLPYIRDKRARRALKGDKGDKEIYHLSETMREIRWAILLGNMHQNGSKRKRFYRMKQRIAQLKRLDKRQHLIDDLVETTGMPEDYLVDVIMKAGSICETWRESHACGKMKRMDYLIDLITNYLPTFDDFCKGCQSMIVVAYTEVEEPMTEEEDNLLYAHTGAVMANKGINYELVCGDGENLQGEIALRIIGISKDK